MRCLVMMVLCFVNFKVENGYCLPLVAPGKADDMILPGDEISSITGVAPS